MKSRRILLTGLSTHWGGRIAQQLEGDPEVETIVGVDSEEPRVELERTEFVRTGNQHGLIKRIVHAAEIDTVIDTRLVVDSTTTSPKLAHENNVIGTMNILAGCSAPDSPVRKFVFKSSAHFYGCEQDDPAFFTEEMRRPHPPRTLLEKDIVEVERAIADYAARRPEATVTLLRFANAIGPDLETSHTRFFSLPAVPTILGFDPRYQFIHEDDIVTALLHAVREDLPGVFNLAADGVLVLSEVIDLLDRRALPVIPPFGTDLVVNQVLKRFGLRIPPEMLRQLRFGRGLDNRRFKATGFEYGRTTREAVVALREHQRTARLTSAEARGYVYEREVEEFLRWSPSVRRQGLVGENGHHAAPAPHAPLAAYDELDAHEVVAVLGSLSPEDLEELRDYEREHARRVEILEAIERRLAARDAGSG